MKRIWEFTAYRSYLEEKLGGPGSRTGLRKQLAEAIPVHTTFVSQVLTNRADFSLEQAEAINDFLDHSEEEGEYFILLLLRERAGAVTLRKRFDRKIQEMRDRRLNIKARLQVDKAISSLDQEKFYSSHVYGAAHVLTSIPDFQTTEDLAKALKLSHSRVQDIVEFLARLGVVEVRSGKLRPGSRHIHLSNESELILKHHANWRLHAINSLQFLDREDVHYSGCVSLSQEDAFKVKESLLSNLKSNADTISKSKEELAYVLNIDFYKFPV